MSGQATPGIRAVVFDMDGVLIDSEPLWRRAEVECFARVGLAITETDCLQTTGLRIDEAVGWWFERAPWEGESVASVAASIVDRMVELVGAEGVPIAGAEASTTAAHARGHRVAIASSSPQRLIDAVLARFGWRDRFDAICSAEHESRGKPHPDVYLSAARAVGVPSAECLAVEDSGNGVASAVAAGMPCVAIPEIADDDDPRFDSATWRLDGLGDLPALLDELDTAPA